MILKSAYNELYTKQVLKFFWEKYIQNGNSKTIIYAKDIYETLGYEMTVQEEYTKNTLSEEFFSWFVSNGGFPQNRSKNWNKKDIGEKMTEVEQAFNRGDYFHMRFSTSEKSNIRFLLNPLKNVDSFCLMKTLYEKKTSIVHMKCFGKQGKQDKRLKVDKVVIYFHRKNIDEVEIAIKNSFLKNANEQITPFCSLVTIENLFLGVACEKKGTSFTIERTLDMINFLTNKKPSFYNPNKIVLLNESISEYKSDCTKFVSDCYEFIIARIEKWWRL